MTAIPPAGRDARPEFVRCEYCGLHYHHTEINAHRIADHNEPAAVSPDAPEPRACPTCAKPVTRCPVEPHGEAFVCFNTSCNDLTVRPAAPRPAGPTPEGTREPHETPEYAERSLWSELRDEAKGDDYARLYVTAWELRAVLTALAAARAALDDMRERLDADPNVLGRALIAENEQLQSALSEATRREEAWKAFATHLIWCDDCAQSDQLCIAAKRLEVTARAARSAVSRDTPGKWLNGSAVRDVVENVNAYDRLDPASRAVSRGEADNG